MDRLIQEKCVACRGDAPRLSDSEIAHLKHETCAFYLFIRTHQT